MFRKMEESSGNIIGFLAIGNFDEADFDALSAEVQAVIDAYGSARLLIDLQQFVSEKLSAWTADLKFSQTYGAKIERLAVVGDMVWEEYFAQVATPFYAQEAEFFPTIQRSLAWAWLKE